MSSAVACPPPFERILAYLSITIVAALLIYKIIELASLSPSWGVFESFISTWFLRYPASKNWTDIPPIASEDVAAAKAEEQVISVALSFNTYTDKGSL